MSKTVWIYKSHLFRLTSTMLEHVNQQINTSRERY